MKRLIFATIVLAMLFSSVALATNWNGGRYEFPGGGGTSSGSSGDLNGITDGNIPKRSGNALGNAIDGTDFFSPHTLDVPDLGTMTGILVRQADGNFTEANSTTDVNVRDINVGGSLRAKMPGFIVAYNASANVKALGQYICDGIDDHNEIQAAVNSGLSHLKLSEGNFDINCLITIANTRNGLVLEGSGPNTILTISPKIQTNLTADFAYTGTSVSVVSTQGFLVGQHCTIFDDANSTYNLGATVRITDIPNTTTLTVANGGDGIDSWHNNAKTYKAISQNARIFTAFSAIRVKDANDIVIKNLTINGNAANNTTGNYDNWQNDIEFLGCQRPKIENVQIYNAIYCGLLGYMNVVTSVDTNFMTVLNCYFENNGIGGGLHFHGCDNAIIANCRFFNNVVKSIYIGYSISNKFSNIDIIGGDYGIALMNSNDNIFKGLLIKGIRGTTARSISTAGTSAGNRFIGFDIDDAVNAANSAVGIAVAGPNNMFTTGRVRNIQGDAVLATTAANTKFDSVDVDVNRIWKGAYSFNTCPYSSVTNCKITHFYGYGDCLAESSSAYMKFNNNIVNNPVDAGNTYSLPSINTSSAGVAITNNTFIDAGSKQVIQSTGANAIITSNYIESTDSAPDVNIAALYASGPNDVVIGNVVKSATRNAKISVTDPCSANLGNVTP